MNYAVILYDKSRSKIQIVQEIAEELPAASGTAERSRRRSSDAP